jgi:hypothetical protein
MRYLVRTICCITLLILISSPLIWEIEASAQAWRNKPVESTVIVDNALNCITCNGWDISYDSGLTHIVTDTTAPVSKNNVLRFTYPLGFRSGDAPSIVYYPLAGHTDLFVAYAWKASDPFQGKSGGDGVNKHVFLFTHVDHVRPDQLIYTNMRGSGNDPFYFELRISNGGNLCNGHVEGTVGDACGSRNFPGNVSSGFVARGVWHKSEIYIKLSTTPTSRDGVLRYWVDGTLVGNFTTVNFGATDWSEFQFSPTFGGGNDETKTQTDYLWFDHVHISKPGISGVSNISPPPSPTGLLVH